MNNWDSDYQYEHSDSQDVLLAHETEQDYEHPQQPIAPIPVTVADAVVTLPLIGQHSSVYTVVLTTTNPIAELVGLDPLRLGVSVWVLDHDVVLCHSEAQANDSRNQDTALARPNGAVLSTSGGFPTAIPINSTQQLWVVGNTFPSRVSVIVNRRSG